MTDTRRRVKLYALNAERQWDDKGTGHVSSTYVERLKGISLLVRAESDGEILDNIDIPKCGVPKVGISAWEISIIDEKLERKVVLKCLKLPVFTWPSACYH